VDMAGKTLWMKAKKSARQARFGRSVRWEN
jgi:hypothetical protein